MTPSVIRTLALSQLLSYCELDPNIICGGQLPTGIARVDRPGGLDQHQMAFAPGCRLVLDPLRNHEHLSSLEVNAAVTKLNRQLSVDNDEDLVCFSVAVPDKLSEGFDQLEMVVVHLRNDLW